MSLLGHSEQSQSGDFAEFLVGAALGVLDAPRIEWDGYDLLYSNRKIEVKASSYVQSWAQTRLSKIVFDIAPKNALDSATNTFANKVQRSADCYVFCLYTEIDRDQADVFNIDKWEFYIIATTQIDDICGDQKTLALSRLKQLGEAIKYEQIRLTLDNMMAHF